MSKEKIICCLLAIFLMMTAESIQAQVLRSGKSEREARYSRPSSAKENVRTAAVSADGILKKLDSLYEKAKSRKGSKAELVRELKGLLQNNQNLNKNGYEKLYRDIPFMINQWDTLDYKLYFVKEGDCLWKIAGIFRNSFLWPVIFEANRESIQDPDRIFPSQRIRIPGIIFSAMSDTSLIKDFDLADPDTTSPEKKADELCNVSEDKSILPTTREFLNIDGIIVDETISKIGRDFYEEFYNRWEAPQDAKNFTIYISEKPQPRLLTLISVKINDYEVFQEFLHPRNNIIEEYVDAALQQCTAFLESYEEIIKELEGEELKGSGIH